MWAVSARISGKCRLGRIFPCSSLQRTNPQGIVGLGRVHPAIVDAHVLIPDIGHAAPHHDIGRVAHQLVRDPVVVRIPMVPTHRRRQRQSIATHDPKRALVTPSLFVARSVTSYSPRTGAVPVMMPVAASTRRPSGRSVHRRIPSAGRPSSGFGRETDSQVDIHKPQDR